MDVKRLPYLPLHYFYFQFETAVRRIFWIGMGALMLTGALILFAYYQPYFWVLDIQSVAETETLKVNPVVIEESYRSIPVYFDAIRQWISFYAGPLQLHVFPLAFWLMAQLIAWSIILSAGSLIKSKWWAFGIYLLFAVFFHQSGITKLAFGIEGWIGSLVEFLIIAGLLGLAYAFQAGMIKVNALIRFISIASVLFFLAGLALMRQPALNVLQQFGQESYIFLIILTLIYTFWIAKEPTNLIIYAASNRPQRRNRLDARILVLIYLLWMVVLTIMIHEALNLDWIPVESLGIRPVHLFVLSILFTVFTSQNQFRAARDSGVTQSAFSLINLGMALIVGSFIYSHYALGDDVFRSAFERFFAIVFAGIGLGHIFYLLLNFRPLLRMKVNLYYLLGQGPRFSIWIVWLIGLGIWIFSEGWENWKSRRMLTGSYAIMLGDHHFLRGESDQAKSYYEAATEFVPTGIKGHYNLAFLILSDPEAVNEALVHYDLASSYREFPYARINGANLLRINRQTEDALRFLKQGWDPELANPYLANNLGLLYHQQNLADSAIIVWKSALNSDLHLAAAYNNLANHYQIYEKNKIAGEFFESGMKLKEPPIGLVNSAIAYSLFTGESINIPEVSQDDYSLYYNKALLALAEDDSTALSQYLSKIPDQELGIGGAILDMWRLFQADSTELALSRLSFLEQTRASNVAAAEYIIAALYYSRSVPEMAEKYFYKAGVNGDSLGYLYAAKMLLDQGRIEEGYDSLGAARVRVPALWDSCAKEIAIALKAYQGGEETFARTEWDLSTLNRNERMRLSLYADSLSQFGVALNNFREILSENPEYLAPYEEMGRIYTRYNDPFAKVVIRDGLNVSSEDPDLNGLLGQVFIQQGELDSAKVIYQKFSTNADSTYELKKFIAEWYVSQKDTARAIKKWVEIYEDNILDTEATLRLATLFAETGEVDLGNELIVRAVNLNDSNSELWYWYAWYSKRWGMVADAAYGAAKALELTRDRERTRQINEEFQKELQELARQNN